MTNTISVSFWELPFYVGIATMFVASMCGALLGSFIVSRVHRATKSHKPILRGSSECRSCGHKLQLIDSVPLFSFLFLKAKCRTCRKSIPWRYFLIELTLAAVVALIILFTGFTLGALGKIAASFILLTILLIDLDTWLIPNALAVVLILWGLLFGMIAPEGFNLVERAIGSAAGFGVLSAVLLATTWLFRRTGRLKKNEWAMGWGDPLLMAGIGAVIGYRWLVVVLWLASLQAIVAYFYLWIRRDNFAVLAEEAHAEQDFSPPTHALPFGTFLCLAAIEMLVAVSYFGY